MNLRSYQLAAVESTEKELKNHRSTLICLPTGGGKTAIAAELIRRFQPRRAVFLSHREVLSQQAVRSIERWTGLQTSVEMAELYASESEWFKTPVVVSTVQTQCSGRGGHGRMTRFNPMEFGLLIADEAHHWVSPQFVKVLNYWKSNPDLKIVGLTATPDRSSEEALGQEFDSVATDIEILDLINEGWLVPVDQLMVAVDGLDYSAVRTTAGDLNGADLAKVMEYERTMQEMVAASVDIIGNRKTLVFTVTVKQAERTADIFNRHRSGMATWVCGTTPKHQRHGIFSDFATGRTQVLVNVGICSEGYDEPSIEVIVQGRPTKSRSLYAQQIGRGLRPLPGVVDGLQTADERKSAIAASNKREVLIIDFVGNAGRHKLMSVANALAGKLDDEVIARATERARQAGGPTRTDEEIAAAIADVEERRRLEAARKARLVARAQYRTTTINPFSAFEFTPVRVREWQHGKTLTEKQRAILRKMNLDPDARTYGENCQLIAEQIRRWTKKLCTIGQANLLQRFGYETRDLGFGEASKLIDALKKNGWKR